MSQIVVGCILLAVAAVLGAIGTHMVKTGLESKRTSTASPASPHKVSSDNPVTVTNNQGPVQIVQNSPGAQQVINSKRVLRNEVKRELGMRGDLFVLKLTFPQTEGIWDAGQQFSLQIQLSGPYRSAKFLSGYFPPNTLTDVVTTNGVPEAYAKGYFEHTTSTPPALGAIVVEFESATKVDVIEIRARPADGYGAPR